MTRTGRIAERLRKRGMMKRAESVALRYGVELEDMLGEGHMQAPTVARRALMLEIKEAYPYSNVDIARLFEVHNTTARIGCLSAKKARDNG